MSERTTQASRQGGAKTRFWHSGCGALLRCARSVGCALQLAADPTRVQRLKDRMSEVREFGGQMSEVRGQNERQL